jgi:hypothetical protein
MFIHCPMVALKLRNQADCGLGLEHDVDHEPQPMVPQYPHGQIHDVEVPWVRLALGDIRALSEFLPVAHPSSQEALFAFQD